jgi:ubiquitin C-terminal hydrolase
MQGLENLGSTCAINSLIQIICKNNYLRDVILESNTPENSLSYELKEILDLMHNKGHSVKPSRFISKFYILFGNIFNKGEQIDISELWLFLFQKISEEISIDNNIKYKNIKISDSILYNNEELSYNKTFIDNCNYSINSFNNNKIGKVFDTSQGILLNIIKCKNCNNIIYNFEPFITIELDIASYNNDVPRINKLFRNFLNPQECNNWNCDKCNTYTEYTKSIKIWKLPKVLFFVLKRFANATTKNNNPVNINKNLLIKRGSVISDIYNNYNYNLSSIGMHSGNLNSGHYFAVCNIEDGEKNKHCIFDDINISIINGEHYDRLLENSRDAYMIVYSLDSNQ